MRCRGREMKEASESSESAWKIDSKNLHVNRGLKTNFKEALSCVYFRTVLPS